MSLIIIGFLMISVSVALIVISSRKPDYLEGSMERKKNEVAAVINEAEQMLEELNKFSEYIVTQMDFKSEELRNSLRYFEQQVNTIVAEKNKEIEAISQALPEQHRLFANTFQTVREHDNVIPLDSRYREIVRLAGEGLSAVEIAKRLKIGKGEIQLVVDINK